MSSPARPAVSVIIPVYNGEKTIGPCLEALFLSEYRDFEVIVVNDGSTDSTHQIVSRFPCRLEREQNAGPGAARNMGALKARGDILFFLDADILVKPGSLSSLVATFASRPEIGALFGSFGKVAGSDDFITVYKNLFHHYTHQTAEENAATFCGGFGAIRREAFEAVGGFDPRHRYLEDVEMGYRLHQAGIAILLCKDLQLTHSKEYTLLSLIRSDLFGRAVPWTRLMLSLRLFRNDLNTRTHNIFSVPCSVALALGLILVPVGALAGHGIPAGLLGAMAALAICLVWLNWRFLAFLTHEKGPGFAHKAAALLWLGYVYSAVGVAIGVWLYISSDRVPFAGAADGKLLEDPDLGAR